MIRPAIDGPHETVMRQDDDSSLGPPAVASDHLPVIEFEDLTSLADDDWAVLIRAAEPPIVLLALTGASEQLLRRVTQRLTKRESQLLQDRLQRTGPLRLSDIEQAQRNMASLASRLAARGEIQLPERRGFAAAA
jgi:flagellar motor switch protein FliG